MVLFKRNKISLSDTIPSEEPQKSRKPPNTAFRQQRLKSWQPILSPQSVLPLLILVACIFAPIGVGLIVSVSNVQDLVINYSKCHELASKDSFQSIPNKYVHSHFKKSLSVKPSWKLDENKNGDLKCQLQFEIPDNLKRSVFIYYKLTNFYQNHRKYVESHDTGQLKGKAIPPNNLDNNCNPLKEKDEKAVYPCGLIANSLFNDTFSQTLKGQGNATDYSLTNKGISWKTDQHRFKKTSYNASEIVPPPNWIKKFPQGYTDDNIPDISTWEELQVWMRTAALPTFYKLALKNETTELPSGNYTMEIGLNYPVSMFGGTKSLVLTTNSVIGVRNMSMGVVYCIVAGVSALFAIIFLIKVIIRPRTMGDHSYLSFEEPFESRERSPSGNIPTREIL
ncbi:hypothetical protein ZYGR_0N07530 [Zygosaccharomyces rouxii]|uniref:ZYRO0D17534p n=2 Tax=Zygosaccharomyces rouxii TaxID=4956 RepID=C5DWU0_ZYGRC|nr:uncharacterized protein ZYRO0D17534g [Zygosaccharomyces rouxii]KAH9201169.1 ligand-effect modulator 3 family [Zygosaccharomyces rouxii]CAQ43261.1 Cell division control protein 50 [Zygosaccharomyces rouxii]CAQ43518.1 Uncharacterized protein YNR048W and Cell division control protein 50 [Zygosaccharomyces rouxii]CAR28259.1 ZYRO0D17534p [Zygosaccharomyces rouxii]GAV49346.1 hypothetical protein ZYGR_0N07530 [Zygosaccharomyces rouxii]